MPNSNLSSFIHASWADDPETDASNLFKFATGLEINDKT